MPWRRGDLRPTPAQARKGHCEIREGTDYLATPVGRQDIIITNPSYSLALAFLRKSAKRGGHAGQRRQRAAVAVDTPQSVTHYGRRWPILLGIRTMTGERWHSVDEVATHLGVARDTVYRWIEQKGLPAHRMGRLWKFKLAEVDAWVLSSGADEEDAGEDVRARARTRSR